MTVIDITAEDPFLSPSKEFFRNPYRFYSDIRNKGNLVLSTAGETRWIVVGYDAAIRVFNDQRFSAETPVDAEVFDDVRHNVRYQSLITGFTKMMLSMDPPQHTRVRKLANKAFTRAEVDSMSARLNEIIDGLIDRMVASDNVDLVRDFALPLPLTVICEILGLPKEDHQQFRRWSEDSARAGEPVVDGVMLEAAAKSTHELFEYLKNLIAERRNNPGKDLLSAFVQAEEDGDKLSLDELLANMLLLIIAGHETTVNLISSGMLALIENPDAMRKLREQPDLTPSAIEEFLRYQSPFQITERFIKEDLEFEKQQLKKGERVSIVIGACNRDGRQFENPDVLNIERSPNKHLAFGQGIHFCLGAPLARFEVNLAFRKLLSRLDKIELATDEVQYKPAAAFRALTSLPLAIKAR